MMGIFFAVLTVALVMIAAELIKITKSLLEFNDKNWADIFFFVVMILLDGIAVTALVAGLITCIT